MKATSLDRRTSKPRPALGLISTKEFSREDWLQIRKQSICSSDAAAAVGLNPYKSQLELWLEMTGRDATMPKADLEDQDQDQERPHPQAKYSLTKPGARRFLIG